MALNMHDDNINPLRPPRNNEGDPVKLLFQESMVNDEEKKNLEPTNSNNNNNNGSKQSATLVMKTDGGLYTPPIEKKLGVSYLCIYI